MTHQEIIIIVATLSFASTFGVFVAIRKIQQYTRSPMNVLSRENRDIELVDYIEPTPPQQTYHGEFDFFNPQFHNYERISNYYPPSYVSGPIPSYRSGTLPSYQSVDRYNISCYLENENPDYIF